MGRIADLLKLRREEEQISSNGHSKKSVKSTMPRLIEQRDEVDIERKRKHTEYEIAMGKFTMLFDILTESYGTAPRGVIIVEHVGTSYELELLDLGMQSGWHRLKYNILILPGREDYFSTRPVNPHRTAPSLWANKF